MRGGGRNGGIQVNRKVILTLIDGLRADAVRMCANPYVEELLSQSSYTLSAHTVMPSLTLPCHMSLFHSVDPERHGVTTNIYTPQVRPIEGIVERLDRLEKKSAFFLTWEELRDLSRPDHLAYSLTINEHRNAHADDRITDAAIEYIRSEQPDFVFLYLGDTDEKGGHDTGWMSETYLKVVANAFDCVARVRAAASEDYDLIVTADHGGHGRHHGTDMPEDMTIPIILNGASFLKGRTFSGATIKDIAPTIAALTGATPAKEWEGHSLL